MGFYPREKRHIRGRKTLINAKCLIHPVYVVGEERGCYLVFGITHARRKGKGHANHKLAKNPNPNDRSEAYLRKKLELVTKFMVTKSIYHWGPLSKQDDDYVDSLIAKRLRT